MPVRTRQLYNFVRNRDKSARFDMRVRLDSALDVPKRLRDSGLSRSTRGQCETFFDKFTGVCALRTLRFPSSSIFLI